MHNKMKISRSNRVRCTDYVRQEHLQYFWPKTLEPGNYQFKYCNLIQKLQFTQASVKKKCRIQTPIAAHRLINFCRTTYPLTLASLGESLHSFKEERNHLSIWSFDCTFHTRNTNRSCNLYKKGDSAGHLRGQIQNIHVCIFPLGYKEHI